MAPRRFRFCARRGGAAELHNSHSQPCQRRGAVQVKSSARRAELHVWRAPRASERDIAGLERAAQSLSRQRGRVGGVVQPPGAVIIVEVVVWVVGPDAYRGLVVFMNSHVVRG